jgi:hypothetical protein
MRPPSGPPSPSGEGPRVRSQAANAPILEYSYPAFFAITLTLADREEDAWTLPT